MSWIAWAALIGAGAWIPQIIYFIYYKFIKPKLNFIPESTIEIGYSFYGPILNPTFAISAARKDALIEKIRIKMVHDATKEEHEFIWQFLDERGFEGTSSKGEKLEMRKTQSAIALKIGVVGLIEKKILFNDTSFLRRRLELETSLYEQEDFLRRTRSQEYPSIIFQTKEYTDLIDFLRTSFYWKGGEYRLYLYVDEISSRKPHLEKFTFNLRKTDLDKLERNIETTQKFLGSSIEFRAGTITNFPYYFWNWVYPIITRIND